MSKERKRKRKRKRTTGLRNFWIRNPQTQVVPNKKAYNRKQEKQKQNRMED